ncbi:hypothetical protein [Paludisphaera mucosa]|uniref:Uncharacterized protein n=1 Tax=Paludisphaera mucosa TaxID=3030827 RepID=A0ABT6FDG3_9BACT|nr:hypothetical protein [Paludisphaera mucosa]MDG3005582.1 hypothetical protein [Paludisphaera mucosa]
MGFRRSKADALQSRAWQDFLQAHAALLQGSGVPITIYESRDRFDQLLMHGCVDSSLDPGRFSVGALTQIQRRKSAEAVSLYLRAGFPNPGISMGPLLVEELRRAGVES